MNLDSILEKLNEDNIDPKVLRQMFEEHDLNPQCRRFCSICDEFAKEDFQYFDKENSYADRYPGQSWIFLSEAIINHPNCDESLQREIHSWVYAHNDAEWSRRIDEAMVSNINISLELLEEMGKFEVNGAVILLVKHHPKLTKEIKKRILAERGWSKWPKDNLLIDNQFVDNESDEFDSIRVIE